MAKKQSKDITEEGRQTRKDVLRARRQAEQLRQVYIAVGVVVGLILIVVVVGVVNEFFIVPNQPVAIVNEQEIGVREWQQRVRFERVQRVAFLENQYEAFDGNVGIIQQIAGSFLQELLDPDALGQGVLNQMVEEEIIRQEAEARGITVTDADIDEEIGEFFAYYGGDSPTATATGTATVVPTPSLTPIPTAVITEVLPTAEPFPTPVPGPTTTPLPTATPVTEEAFQEQLDELMTQYREFGSNEEQYRLSVRASLYRERLLDELGIENEVSTEAEHASVFVLTLVSEADANEAAALIAEVGYLPIWNQVRSTPPTTETVAFAGATATEYLWQTEDTLTSIIGEEAAAAAFTLALDEASDVLVQEAAEGANQYHVVQVSGREVRELPESTVDAAKEQLLQGLIDAITAEGVETTDAWRSRVPDQPLLDPKFLVQPTPVPTQPLQDTLLTPVPEQ